VVPRDGRTRQIEADHLIPQVGAKVGGNCFRDFDGVELQAACPTVLPARAETATQHARRDSSDGPVRRERLIKIGARVIEFGD
jgi:hypothetical protein